ncbi:MAG TPA: hypoxanthine phosphoribosyltransferase [Thermoanaerobaculia bacterium]|nr:hypoxanthine phosphoribosyltransferase [Thermoanaerobaculia bacterium]
MGPSKLPRVLISADALQRRITELAREIEGHYAGCEDLTCIGVLKGSVFFMVDLLKQIDLPVVVDFFQTSSYQGSKAPGEVRIKNDVETPVRGRDVLLIEDIVDTGHTLRTVLALLEFRGARSVKLCALLDKREAREVEVPIDFCGFPIDNVFVVGFGLDYDERYRNLPYIGVVD